MREPAGNDATEYRRLMEPLWRSDNEAALEALVASPLRTQRLEAFRCCSATSWPTREGIENWKRLPAAWRRGEGRQPERIKSGSGAVEKNVEVAINRRFKR